MSSLFMKRVYAIYDFAAQYKRERNLTPTLKEIESGTGISHRTVAKYLDMMSRMGMIEYTGAARHHFDLIRRNANWTALVHDDPVPISAQG